MIPRLLLVLLLAVGAAASPALRAQDAPPRVELPATPGLEVLKLLGRSRIAEAEQALSRVADDDPLAPWARAWTAFHQGDYPRAMELLPPVGDPHEAALAHVRPRIEGALEATEPMLERREGDFLLRFAPGVDAILVDYALDALGEQRIFMQRLLGAAPPAPVIVEFMPDTRSFLLDSGLPESWVRTTNTVAIAKWGRMIVLSPMNMSFGYPWKDTLAHEYVHLALAWASEDELPVWFQEGSAKVFESRWRNPRGGDALDLRSESLLARAVREDALISFDAMHPSMAALPSASDAALAFAEVATAIEFLLEEEGPEGYRRVVENTRMHGDVMRAISQLIGPGLGGFEARWKRHLRGRDLKERADISELKPKIEDGAGGHADPGATRLDPVLEQQDRMQDLTRVGDLLRTRGHLRAALIEYDRAEAAGAFHSPALANKQARTLQALSEPAEAVQVLHRSVELYPEYTPTVSLLARLAAEAGDDRTAERMAARAIGLNPFDPTIHQTLIELHERAGRVEEKAHEERVLQILADHLAR